MGNQQAGRGCSYPNTHLKHPPASSADAALWGAALPRAGPKSPPPPPQSLCGSPLALGCRWAGASAARRRPSSKRARRPSTLYCMVSPCRALSLPHDGLLAATLRRRSGLQRRCCSDRGALLHASARRVTARNCCTAHSTSKEARTRASSESRRSLRGWKRSAGISALSCRSSSSADGSMAAGAATAPEALGWTAGIGPAACSAAPATAAGMPCRCTKQTVDSSLFAKHVTTQPLPCGYWCTVVQASMCTCWSKTKLCDTDTGGDVPPQKSMMPGLLLLSARCTSSTTLESGPTSGHLDADKPVHVSAKHQAVL